VEGDGDVLGPETAVTSYRADFDVDVVVVGTGPTGTAAALALSTYGIDVLVLTHHGRLSDNPSAHITNQRAKRCSSRSASSHRLLWPNWLSRCWPGTGA
jgi:choline dehydrogenase-like flavoprotein